MANRKEYILKMKAQLDDYGCQEKLTELCSFDSSPSLPDSPQ